MSQFHLLRGTCQRVALDAGGTQEAAAQAAVSNVSTQELSAAEEEAEAALQYLEAEWAVRMEAPLSALAALEDNLSHAIETAMLRLPGYQ